MKFFALVVLVLFGGYTASGQNASTLPAGWRIFDTGGVDPGAAIKCPSFAVGEQRDWMVEPGATTAKIELLPRRRTDGGNLPAGFVRTKEMVGRAVSQHVGAGTLIGFDAGEWGGSLWFQPDTGGSALELQNGNVHAIFVVPGGALVLTGLAHMSFDSGKVFFAHTDATAKNGWALEETANLGGAPEAAIADTSSSFLVATTHQLVRLDVKGHAEVLGTLPKYLYANSIEVEPGGVIYVGMRIFVIRLAPSAKGYAAEALVPNDCPMRQVPIKNSGLPMCTCNAGEIQ